MSEAAYHHAYKQLNDAQRRAVNQTDGPVLVIAGPGTGKTQLLTTRIAHILATTDTAAENILCLTFTDAAAANMRERLATLIGNDAYRVTISTYHAFGSDLLKRYPEFFADAQELEPADALMIDQTLRAVQAGLPFKNPLKYQVFLPDLKTLISDYKRALLTPDDVRDIAKANQKFLTAASQAVQQCLGDMPKITKASLAAFEQLLDASAQLSADSLPGTEPLQILWQDSLQSAIEAAQESGKTSSLTAWKNRWLAKDADGKFIASGAEAVRKQLAAADIYEQYLQLLKKYGLYDYDDMILQAISGLESQPELRFTLQERYQYLLLDEFQDTNRAQLKLVELLTDNPVNEGRPNVLAVGDDDQAIYAFQGADYSHMLEFANHFRDVLVVPLTENYRSQAAILQLAEGVSGQIEERLHHHFPKADKTLTAASKPEKVHIERAEFLTDLGQNAWIARQIAALIQSGKAAPHDIAILAPKHQFLESLLPFLRQQNIPMRYEKRENILDDAGIGNLLLMSRMVLTLDQPQAAAALWPQLLSLPFWNIPTLTIWQLAWQAGREGDWLPLLLETPETRTIALFFMRLRLLAATEPLELMLDYLIGVTPLDLQQPDVENTYQSPFYDYYFDSKTVQPDAPVNFWQLLSNLTVLRQRLRDYQRGQTETLKLQDFLQFVSAHQAAGIKILNTNPYQDADDAVQIMTAYKAKGQEFKVVFAVALNDEVWGSRARNQSSRVAIPENLQFIRYAGASQDERLRLLYVALTRAKTTLYLTNFTTNFSGTAQHRLQFLQEYMNEANQVISPLLPAGSQQIHTVDQALPSLEDITSYWHDRHRDGLNQPLLREALSERLKHLQLSASQLNRFTDTTIDGPRSFLLRHLLRFPSGSTPAGTYGDVVHACLHWLQLQLQATGKLPTEAVLLKHFDQVLQAKHLSTEQVEQFSSRGHDCLRAFLAHRAPLFTAADRSEYNFRQEGVLVGEAHLTGSIDRLIIDETARTITIVDFKTGKAHARWTNDLKLLHYRQQLYFYKLLVEGSAQFRGYTVVGGYLDFVEPDAASGQLTQLQLTFDEAEADALRALIRGVWQHIMRLEFPSVADYSTDAKGMLAFQQALRDGTLL